MKGKTKRDNEVSPLMSVNEAAQLAGVSRNTIIRMCADEQLPAVKMRSTWRINRAKFTEILGIEIPQAVA